MIHAREDYNRIQDPVGKIADDEPVFMVRAQDKLAPAVMRHWAMLQRLIGGDPKMAQMVEDHALKAEEWQRENGCKVADIITTRTPADSK